MAREFGWAYVVGSQASGPKGSIQLAGIETGLDHDPNLVWSDELNALVVSGNIIAKNFEIQNETKTVTNLDVYGSSNFGDTIDDIHTFTGSLYITGVVHADSFVGWVGDADGVAVNYYTEQGDYRLITSNGLKSIKGEENLTFDGTTLGVVGDINSTNIFTTTIESDVAWISDLTSDLITSTTLTDGTVVITNGTINGVDNFDANTLGGTLTTAAQPNITSVGTLNSLSVSGDATFSLDVLKIDSINKRVGVSKLNPQKKVEIKDRNSQLRLTNTDYVFGISDYKWSDLFTNAFGDLSLIPSSGKVIAPSLNLTNVTEAIPANNFYLGLDSNGNVVKSAVNSSPIEIRNRTVVTSNYSVTANDYFIGINANSNLTIQLPSASSLQNGQIMIIKDEARNADIYDLIISAAVGQQIDGLQQVKLSSPGSSMSIYTDGISNFFIF